MALLFSFSCAAAENTTTYRFSDINLEVQVPSELIGFTRSVTSNNAYLDLIGTDDVEELRSLMVVNHVYLSAAKKQEVHQPILRNFPIRIWTAFLMNICRKVMP